MPPAKNASRPSIRRSPAEKEKSGASIAHPGRRALLRLVLDRELDAPAEVVWVHLTTAQGLVRWVGPEAVADLTPDGA